MPDDIFISYSRKDQEFVTRLASDLNARVTGVWFDRSDIQAGQRWRDQIEQGIRDCKVVILVLSPASAASQNVQMEINLALEEKKRIIPILYNQVKLSGPLADLVDETQYIDLRRGSYTDNFQLLVDGLISAGAAPQARSGTDRPFLRKSARTDWGAVIGRIPGWGLAWGLGWTIFGIALSVIGIISKAQFEGLELVIIPLSTFIGGLVGGLVAGFITMLALRRFAPSVNWKHMSPAIRIWAISGPIGLMVSIGLAVLIFNPAQPNSTCGEENLIASIACIALVGLAHSLVIILFRILLVLIFVTIVWFLTGLVSGWLVVRHIRRLEPSISRGRSGWVMFGWGVGALVGAVGTLIALSLLLQMSGISF